MRDSVIIGYLRDQENKIIAGRRMAFETSMDLLVLKELLFEKNVITKEEYEAKIKAKTEEFIRKVQEAQQPKQETKTEEPAPVLEVPAAPVDAAPVPVEEEKTPA